MNMNPIQPGEGSLGSQFQVRRNAMPDSVIRWRMDTSDVVNDLKDSLGVIGNEKLISRAMALLKSIINKSTIQGNIQDEERASEIALAIADDETNFIGQHYAAYGVHPSDRDMYIDIIATYVFMGLTRPILDKERRHTVAQGQENITTHQGVQQYLPFYRGGQQPPMQRQGPL